MAIRDLRNEAIFVLVALCFAGWGAFFFSRQHAACPTSRLESTKPPCVGTQGEMRQAATLHASRGDTLGTFTGHPAHTETVPFYTPFHEYVKSNRKECQRCPLLHKWEPYFAPYHTHFERYRGKVRSPALAWDAAWLVDSDSHGASQKVTFVEVGVQSGGSALMWRWYFGPGLRYFGVDINPLSKLFSRCVRNV